MEPGEPVCVEKTLVSAQSSHRKIMPVSTASSIRENQLPARLSSDFMTKFTHTLSRRPRNQIALALDLDEDQLRTDLPDRRSHSG
jgi:hypothetical protein